MMPHSGGADPEQRAQPGEKPACRGRGTASRTAGEAQRR